MDGELGQREAFDDGNELLRGETVGPYALGERTGPQMTQKSQTLRQALTEEQARMLQQQLNMAEALPGATEGLSPDHEI